MTLLRDTRRANELPDVDATGADMVQECQRSWAVLAKGKSRAKHARSLKLRSQATILGYELSINEVLSKGSASTADSY